MTSSLTPPPSHPQSTRFVQQFPCSTLHALICLFDVRWILTTSQVIVTIIVTIFIIINIIIFIIVVVDVVIIIIITDVTIIVNVIAIIQRLLLLRMYHTCSILVLFVLVFRFTLNNQYVYDLVMEGDYLNTKYTTPPTYQRMYRFQCMLFDCQCDFWQW